MGEGNQIRQRQAGMNIALRAVFVGCTLALSFTATAQYPAKPVRVVVPFPAGGPTDIVGRTIGQKLNETLGQPVIIDNRAGAGGVTATEYAAKATPDGHTILLGSISGLAVAMSLYPNRGYD